MLSFSADDLLKLPFLKTIVVVITIVLCICPGIYMFYLHDTKAFNDMNIIKLLLVVLSMNILFYVGCFALTFMLTTIDSAIEVGTAGALPDDVSVRIRNNIEKSILVNNLMIIFCIAMTIVSLRLFEENFAFEIIIKKFSLFSFSFLFGWFAPNIFNGIIKAFRSRSLIDRSDSNNQNEPGDTRQDS